MRRPSIPIEAKLQPHSQERPQPNHQAETKHNHPKTWKPTMARHAHPMAGRPNHIPQTIPSTQQSRIRLQRLKTMLRKPPSQPQENSPKTRTPPENSQLQHRNSQSNNNQTRKQITFHIQRMPLRGVWHLARCRAVNSALRKRHVPPLSQHRIQT